MPIKATEALELSFKTKLKTFAQTQAIAVDWGDEKEYRPAKQKWLRPRLNPAETIPGPTNRGPLRATLRGLYSVECMAPIELTMQVAYALADAVADHFMPDWTEPQYLASTTHVIHIRAPSVARLQPFESFNRAVAHIPYLVYAKSSTIQSNIVTVGGVPVTVGGIVVTHTP